MFALWAAASGAAAQPADDPAPSVSDEVPAPAAGSWLRRTFHRYFSNDQPAGTELGGQAVELAGRYTAYAGRHIAVVIVHQVDRLRPEDASRSELMSSLSRTLHPYTREGVLRQYLLFRQGDRLDPFKLADTERLLRGIEYVADVRLHVVPVTGDDNEVAVVVEIRDRLPVGLYWSARGVDRTEASLFHSNLAGLDVRLAADFFYRQGVTPEAGWGTRLRKRNMGGAFVDADFVYEDSWRGLDRSVALTRAEAHPDIRWVGSVAWRNRLERNTAQMPVQLDGADGWVGRVIRLRDDRAALFRPVLVPAIGYARVQYSLRPVVSPDSNLGWHNGRQWLAGLTWSRARDYRTSYLHGFGQTENLSGGQGLKLSVVYIEGEYRDRTGLFLQGWRHTVHDRGGMFNLGLDVGGHLRVGTLEDGMLGAAIRYVSPPLGQGRWPSRLLAGVRYHRAVLSSGGGPLSLAGGLGPREFDLPLVQGDRRLALDAEWRLFAPWVAFGFRGQIFTFADAAWLAGQGHSLWAEPLRASAGLGLRVGNPDLILPVVQVRVAFLRGMDDNAAGLIVATGNFTAPETTLPGSRPGGFAFR